MAVEEVLGKSSCWDAKSNTNDKLGLKEGNKQVFKLLCALKTSALTPQTWTEIQ
ncbi:hypothetical protein J6590_090460, partial [Homalodisca vitripennis]